MNAFSMTPTSPFGMTPTSPFSSSASQQGRDTSTSNMQKTFAPQVTPAINYITSLMSPNSRNQQLSNTLIGRAQSGQVNPYTQNTVNAAANQAAYNLPIQANQIRGQFFHGPNGRTQLGLDNAVTQENLGLAGLTAGLQNQQYNQDIQYALQAAGQNVGLAGVGAGLAGAGAGYTGSQTGTSQQQQQSNPSQLANLMALLSGQMGLNGTGNSGMNFAQMLGLGAGPSMGQPTPQASNSYSQPAPAGGGLNSSNWLGITN